MKILGNTYTVSMVEVDERLRFTLRSVSNKSFDICIEMVDTECIWALVIMRSINRRRALEYTVDRGKSNSWYKEKRVAGLNRRNSEIRINRGICLIRGNYKVDVGPLEYRTAEMIFTRSQCETPRAVLNWPKDLVRK
jgi:hypothetical protein